MTDHSPDLSISRHGHHRRNRIFWAIVITGSILILEAVGGIVSGSLALLTDAGHMLTDLASLLITLTAMILAGRPASAKHTFGYSRLEVLAALGNAFTFFLMVLAVSWEAVQRLAHPVLPDWRTMGMIAAIGFLANALSAWFLRGAEENDLNMKSAWLHVLGDLASSVGVLIGVLVIAQTGWAWVDPVLSLGIALLIALNAFRLFWKALHILLESAPSGVTPENISSVLISEIREIKEVHHIHLWEVGSGEIHLTAHLVVQDQPISEGSKIITRAAKVTKEKSGITHSTFQLEAPTRVPLSGPEKMPD